MTTRIKGIASGLLCSIALGAAAEEYQVTDLGANVSPAALNNSRVVVGEVNTPSATPGLPPVSAPFIWQKGVLTKITPANWNGGALLGINSAGTAVGQAQLADPAHPTAPFSYKDGVITYIPIPAAAGSVGAINDAGAIGGFLQDRLASGFFGGNVPFLYENSVITILPSLGGSGGGVTGITPAGIAVGTLDTATWPRDQFAVTWEQHRLKLLPRLGGNSAGANAVNDHGVIVGSSSTGVLFEEHLTTWENGSIRDLGGMPGATRTVGQSINTSGVIVGYAWGIHFPSAAIVYKNNTMQTLDTLAGPSTGWRFLVANAINEQGDIVGLGFPPGSIEVHGFLLSPVIHKTLAQIFDLLLSKIDSFGLDPWTAQALKISLVELRDWMAANPVWSCSLLKWFVFDINVLIGRGLTAQQAKELLDLTLELSFALKC